MKNSKKKDTGDYGERIAISCLLKKGYSIVATKYTVFGGEIDIIAYKEKKSKPPASLSPSQTSPSNSAPQSAPLPPQGEKLSPTEIKKPASPPVAQGQSTMAQSEKAPPDPSIQSNKVTLAHPAQSQSNPFAKTSPSKSTLLATPLQNQNTPQSAPLPPASIVQSQSTMAQSDKAPPVTIAQSLSAKSSDAPLEKKRGTLVFVEVKTLPHGSPESLERVLSYRKKQLLVKTAQLFLLKNRQYSESSIRFDVIAIDVPGLPRVYHIKGAFDGAIN